jgi:hypothetical protein
MQNKLNVRVLIALTLLCGMIAQPSAVHAKGGATDPIPGTSKSGLNSGGSNSGGGGGGGSTTPAPAPAPAPTPVLASGPITFTASAPVNGVTPICTGDFRENAYYPTLLDMTVNVNVSSLNVPDGTVLYISAVPTAGGTLYPYTSNAIVITGGSGTCSESLFVTLGASLAGVVISDASGNVVFVGN